MDGERTPFGPLLKRYRLVRGLTQEALAESARLSVRAISDLERGIKSAPRQETLRLLATALALSPHERGTFEATARGVDLSTSSPAGMSRLIMAVDAGSDERPPLTGRDTEIALLERHIAGRTPPLLLLAGEPGIGKSRLLQEAAQRAPVAGLQVLHGGCARSGGEEPYAPLVEAIERLVRGYELLRLRTILRNCAWLVRLLPELASGPIEPLPDWQLTAAQERRLMFKAVGQLLANVAGPSGTLLLLDDLQWASPDTFDLIATLIRSAGDTRLRVIGTYRDMEVQSTHPLAILLADLRSAGLAAHHLVEPLDDEAAARLLDEVLSGDGSADRDLRDRVLQRTEGVPLFVVSCAEALRRGDLAAGVPWDVAQGIGQRIAALPDDVRIVLASAAVIGRVVPCALLAAVTGLSEEGVLNACEMARRAHLLEEAVGDAYRFAHDLIREVLEGDLGAPRRRALHRRTAAEIEHLWGSGQRGRLPVEQLAYHAVQGGDQEQAIAYLAQAASNAGAATAHREEAALLTQAIALAEDMDSKLRAELRARRGRALFSSGQWTSAREDMEAALAGLPVDQEEERARLLVDLAHLCHWLLDVESQRAYGTAAEALATELGQDELIVSALGALALADSSDGNLQSSLDRQRRAFELAGQHHRPALVPAVEMYALILYWRGDFVEAIRSGREAVALARQVNDITYTARALGNLGLALTGGGHYGEALEVFSEARQFARANDAAPWLARATAMAGGIHLELGDFVGAESMAEEAREIGRKAGFPLAVVSGGIDLLLNLARRQDIGERDEILLREVEAAVAMARGAHAWLWRSRLAQARAELALARNMWPQSLQWAEDALAQARLHGRSKYLVAGLTTQAAALHRTGRTAEAIVSLRQAVQQARQTGDPAMFLRAAADSLALDGDDQLLDEARATVKRMLTTLPNGELQLRFRAAEAVSTILKG